METDKNRDIKYNHYEYKWHLVAIRVVLLGPLLIAKFIFGFVYGFLEELFNQLDNLLPTPYNLEKVPYSELSDSERKREDEADRLRRVVVDRMMSQVAKLPQLK